MTDPNPFQSPTASGLAPDAPPSLPVDFQPTPFRAGDVLSRGSAAALRAGIPAGFLATVFYVVFIVGLCCCLVPGLFVGPLAVASVAGACLDGVDGRAVLDARRFVPFQRWRTWWLAGFLMNVSFMVASLTVSLPALGFSWFFPSLSLIPTYLLGLLFQPVAICFMVATFAWAETGTDAGSALRLAYAAVRHNLRQVYSVGAAFSMLGLVLNLPMRLVQPDPFAALRDPGSYHPTFAAQVVPIVMMLPLLMLAVWQLMVIATVYRTQVPARGDGV